MLVVLNFVVLSCLRWVGSVEKAFVFLKFVVSCTKGTRAYRHGVLKNEGLSSW